MDTPNSQLEQRKDFLIKQANELIESWKDLRNYNNLMDFFDEEAQMMLHLFNSLNEVNAEDIPELQTVVGFYILHAPTKTDKKTKIIEILNRLTLFIIRLKSNNSLIARKQHYYEQLTDEITRMEESESYMYNNNDSATKRILSDFDEIQNN